MFNSADLLTQAIEAAQSGEHERARSLFIEVVDQDPHNAQAWVYLSQLVEDPEDQLIALENALLLLPGDADLLERREAHLQANPQLRVPEDNTFADTLAQARQLADERRFMEAVALLRTLAGQFSSREEPWLELARLESGLHERTQAAKKALSINPHSEEAQLLLDEAQKEQKKPFLRGQHFEERGEVDRAMETYLSIATHSRLPAERLEAQRRMENIQTRQEANHIQPIHPNLNLWRLAAGPVLLFGVLLFMQSGLKLTHLPWQSLPGILSVSAGSLLIALTEMVPVHPLWVKWFGQPGSADEPEMRRGMRLLGWGLMLAPYTIFFIEAGSRLGLLQSTLLSGLR